MISTGVSIFNRDREDLDVSVEAPKLRRSLQTVKQQS